MNTQIPKKNNYVLELINFIPTTVGLEHRKYKNSVSPQSAPRGQHSVHSAGLGMLTPLALGTAYLTFSMKQMI